MVTFLFSSVAFAVAIVCYVLMRMSAKSKHAPWWVVVAFALLGGACLASTPVGGWVAGRLSAWFAPVLIGAVALILVVGIYFDLRDKKADKFARVGLWILPILLLAATGPLASVGQGITGGISDAGTASIGKLIGG